MDLNKRAAAVIGLVGKKRSGKDTVFGFLKGAVDAQRIAFADALKEELAEACKVDVELIEKRKDLFRLGLQWWGSEFRRELFGLDYWIKQALEKYENLTEGSPSAVVVFTDCRFPNEVQLIKDLGGLIWKVRRPEVENSGDSHVSEKALDSLVPDREIVNNGTLEQLRELTITSVEDDFGLATWFPQ